VGDFEHRSVMLDEVIAALAPAPDGIYADVTLGGAGHGSAILEQSAPSGRLIGLDRDSRAVAAASARLARFGERAQIRHAAFSQLGEVLSELGVDALDGLVADLGVSSVQLDEAERGFSLLREGPIDMRMDTSAGETALELIGRCSPEELADLIYRYGEERKSRRIARSILQAYEDGELESTSDLRRAVIRATGPKRGRIDPATRTFQALRIAVNDELGELESLLGALPELLRSGGVAVIISFHSLEDRLVKHAFRHNPQLEPLTKRPLVASEEERDRNPRSRSAKLRAARRLEVAA
jgi:16S rRNA (cytosine1402-N4)-methyltransferase